MRVRTARFVLVLGVIWGAGASAQQPATPPAGSDVYHVHFTKAVPGDAAKLGEFLKAGDPDAPMPGHRLVLRHQDGDDWDFCVIDHLGPTVTVDTKPVPPNPGRDLRAWHDDTFTAGPSWAEFSKAMGIGDAAAETGGSVYTVAVWLARPGHREQLVKALDAANADTTVPTGHVMLQHLEGGPWQYLALTRYNSWADFAKSEEASTGGAPAGWAEVREHSTFHRDTLADRLAPR